MRVCLFAGVKTLCGTAILAVVASAAGGQARALQARCRCSSPPKHMRLCKTNPIPLSAEPMQPSLPQRIMEMNHPGRLEKTNPIKANSPAPKLRHLFVTCTRPLWVTNRIVAALPQIRGWQPQGRRPWGWPGPPERSAPTCHLSLVHTPLYRPRNDRYYTRCMRRCSSTVEHGFRKAGVEGPNPSIGCVTLQSQGAGLPHQFSEARV